MTVQDLPSFAAKERDAVFRLTARRSDSCVEQAVWEQTIEEARRGFLTGPIHPSLVPETTPLSRRFGVAQGGKVRCVDDFTRSGINSTVETHESPRPHTLDIFAALACSVMDLPHASGPWVARPFDLKEAYRQCGVHPDSLQHSHILVLNPADGSLNVFRMNALPFGSVKSVHAFLRIAASLWHVAVTHLKILTTNYFDDYVVMCQEAEAANVTHAFQSLLDLLGWRYAKDGKKAPPFSSTMSALGVSVDVSNLHQGSVAIANTQSRRSEMIALLDRIVQDGRLPFHDALKLRGRMQFSSAQLYGRLVNTCLAKVTQHAYGNISPVLTPDTLSALRLFRLRLAGARPRELSRASELCWVVLTDASYERDGNTAKAGFGGVLVDPAGRISEFFSFELSGEELARLNPRNRKTCIFECEFFALYTAMSLWSGGMSKSQVVFYLDNNAVRDAMISCHTPNAVSQKLLDRCLDMEDRQQLHAWYNRVASPSNIADLPSRHDLEMLVQLGCRRCSPAMSDLLSVVPWELKKGGEYQARLLPFGLQKVCGCWTEWRNRTDKYAVLGIAPYQWSAECGMTCVHVTLMRFKPMSTTCNFHLTSNNVSYVVAPMWIASNVLTPMWIAHAPYITIFTCTSHVMQMFFVFSNCAPPANHPAHPKTNFIKPHPVVSFPKPHPVVPSLFTAFQHCPCQASDGDEMTAFSQPSGSSVWRIPGTRGENTRHDFSHLVFKKCAAAEPSGETEQINYFFYFFF